MIYDIDYKVTTQYSLERIHNSSKYEYRTSFISYESRGSLSSN